MRKQVCQVCGYVSLKEDAPENCPVCFSPKEKFAEKEDALKVAADPDNKTDLEKKHIPLIKVNKACGLIDGCADIHVLMGEIVHPMTQEHLITNIDFYIDDDLISRIKLTPDKLNPAGCLHLKAAEGKLTVVSHCNLHGNWISETSL